MKKVAMLVTLSVLVLGLVSCGPSLSESFDDVQENAPSACKDWCSERTECTWDDNDYEGESADEDGLYDHDVKECVAQCSYRAAEGEYIIDVKDDGDQDIVGKVSGSDYADVFSCIYASELWQCDKEADPSDDHYFYLDYRGDDDGCEIIAECYEALEDVDFECEWDDGNNQCNCHGEDHVDFLTDLIYL